MLGALLDALSMPGDYTRGLLAGRPGDRVNPRDLLAGYGMADPQDDGWLSLARDLGVGALTDPLTYAGGLLGRGLAGRRAAAAASPEAALLDTAAGARSVPMGSGEAFPSSWGEPGYDRALRAAATPPEGALPGMSQAALEADAAAQAAAGMRGAPALGPLTLGLQDPAKLGQALAGGERLSKAAAERELGGLYGVYGDLSQDLAGAPSLEGAVGRLGLADRIGSLESRGALLKRARTPEQMAAMGKVQDEADVMSELLRPNRTVLPDPEPYLRGVDRQAAKGLRSTAEDAAINLQVAAEQGEDFPSALRAVPEQLRRMNTGFLNPERLAEVVQELEQAGFPLHRPRMLENYRAGLGDNFDRWAKAAVEDGSLSGMSRDQIKDLLNRPWEGTGWIERIEGLGQQLPPTSDDPLSLYSRLAAAGRKSLFQPMRNELLAAVLGRSGLT